MHPFFDNEKGYPSANALTVIVIISIKATVSNRSFNISKPFFSLIVTTRMKLPPREWNTQGGSRESRGEEWTNEENRFPISRSLLEGGEKEKRK